MLISLTVSISPSPIFHSSPLLRPRSILNPSSTNLFVFTSVLFLNPVFVLYLILFVTQWSIKRYCVMFGPDFLHSEVKLLLLSWAALVYILLSWSCPRVKKSLNIYTVSTQQYDVIPPVYVSTFACLLGLFVYNHMHNVHASRVTTTPMKVAVD
jgi:hypothetical protein